MFCIVAFIWLVTINAGFYPQTPKLELLFKAQQLNITGEYCSMVWAVELRDFIHRLKKIEWFWTAWQIAPRRNIAQ